jgi:hypothetical protein
MALNFESIVKLQNYLLKQLYEVLVLIVWLSDSHLFNLHPDFSKVPPRPDFSKVLTWFFSDLQVWNPAFFKLPPEKIQGRSYAKKIAPNNSNESYTFMCLGRVGRFGQC